MSPVNVDVKFKFNSDYKAKVEMWSEPSSLGCSACIIGGDGNNIFIVKGSKGNKPVTITCRLSISDINATEPKTIKKILKFKTPSLPSSPKYQPSNTKHKNIANGNTIPIALNIVKMLNFQMMLIIIVISIVLFLFNGMSYRKKEFNNETLSWRKGRYIVATVLLIFLALLTKNTFGYLMPGFDKTFIISGIVFLSITFCVGILFLILFKKSEEYEKSIIVFGTILQIASHIVSAFSDIWGIIRMILFVR